MPSWVSFDHVTKTLNIGMTPGDVSHKQSTDAHIGAFFHGYFDFAKDETPTLDIVLRFGVLCYPHIDGHDCSEPLERSKGIFTSGLTSSP